MEDYRRGYIDGLDRATEILRDLEGKVALRLARESCRRTRDARRVRLKAFQVGTRRIETVLRKARRVASRTASLPTALKELGLG